MYSILIQNSTTMGSFQQFHPLFLDAISNGRIGVCQWFEAGSTIETAVPELYSMTNDKEEWRAVIVRFADESPMAAFETVAGNPYDFLDNQAVDTHVRESSIPLIRLTQMLGGVPSPGVSFEPRLIREANKAPKVIYVPAVSEADQAEYARLSEKYHFNGKPPSEIILVSLSEKQDRRVESVERAWVRKNEIESSEFWKRNGYPSLCRFMFLELQRQGPVQNTADLFRAWMAILLLATNQIDSSTLQAYKLHRLDVEFDAQQMEAVMQDTVNRTVSAREFISKSIQRDLEQKLLQKTPAPNYKLAAPVVVDLPLNQDYFAKKKEFGLTSATAVSDVETWNGMSETAQKAVNDAKKHALRALDHTADQMREYCIYSEKEILPLDTYQKEDMDAELSSIRSEIFAQRSELSEADHTDRDKQEWLEKEIRTEIFRRLTKRQAGLLLLGGMLIFFFSALTSLFYFAKNGAENWFNLVVQLLAGLSVIALSFLIALLVQRGSLWRKLDEFNSSKNAEITRIAEESRAYSDYMGNIASFIHGSSYLRGLKKKGFLSDELQNYKRDHIAALNAFLTDLQEWAVAFHLPVSTESADIQDYLDADLNVTPYRNPLYTFASLGSYPAEVNSSGDCVETPFRFITRLIIKREELYDDAG